jgi:hypothetical protein
MVSVESSPAAPAWARDLAGAVAEHHGAALGVPALRWRRRRGPGSTGRCVLPQARAPQGWIAISAGSDRLEQRHVLLHELAHWLLPRAAHHGPAFYDLAWRLWAAYGIPPERALRREVPYRAEAARAALRHGVPGALVAAVVAEVRPANPLARLTPDVPAHRPVARQLAFAFFA